MTKLPLLGFFAAHAINTVGTKMTMVALPLLVYATTGSATQTGLVAFVEMDMYVAAKALGAPFIDRTGRKRVGVGAEVLAAVTIAAVPLLSDLGGLHLAILLGLVAVCGAAQGLASGANRVQLPDIADRTGTDLERALTIFDGVDRLGSLLGAPLGGLLVAGIGAAHVLWFDGASFLISAVLLAAVLTPDRPGRVGGAVEGSATPEPADADRMATAKPGHAAPIGPESDRIASAKPGPAAESGGTTSVTAEPERAAPMAAKPSRAAAVTADIDRKATAKPGPAAESDRAAVSAAAVDRADPQREPYFASLRAGWLFLRSQRLLLAVTVVIAVGNLLDQAKVAVMVPVWATDVLERPELAGLVFGAGGLGAVCGNLLFIWLAPKLPRFRTFALCYLLSGAPQYLSMAVFDSAEPVIAIAFAVGFNGAALNPILSAVSFERVPDALRTRVFGLTGALAFVGIPLGGLLGGLAVSGFGVIAALWIAGVACLLVTLCPFVFPVWREMDRAAPVLTREQVRS